MKLLAISLLMLLSLTSLASAFTYINIYIDGNGEAIFLGETDTQVSLPEGVRLEGGEILGRTQELTSKAEEVWTFSYTLPNSELNIILPERAKVQSISDPNAEISLDGRRISIFTDSAITIRYTVAPAPSALASNLPYIAIFLGILLVIIVYLVNFSKREKRTNEEKEKRKKEKLKAEKEKQELIKKVLNEREKAILDKLKETGKIKASHLRKMLGIPKASFSRHLQEMEKKGLIKRDGEGKNKFVESSR